MVHKLTPNSFQNGIMSCLIPSLINFVSCTIDYYCGCLEPVGKILREAVFDSPMDS